MVLLDSFSYIKFMEDSTLFNFSAISYIFLFLVRKVCISPINLCDTTCG